MDIGCSIQAAVAAFELFDYLDSNPKITDADAFYNDITKILFEAEPDLRFSLEGYKPGAEGEGTELANYLNDIVAIVSTQAAEIAKLSGRGNTSYTAITGLDPFIVADNLGKGILNKIAQEAEVMTESINEIELEDKSLKSEDIVPEDEGSSSEYNVLGNAGSAQEFLLELGKIRVSQLEDGEITLQQFAATYFAKYPEMMDEFRSFFINNFYDNLIDTRYVGDFPAGYNENIQEVLENTKAELEGKIDTNALVDTPISSILEESSAKVRQSLYASIINAEFNSLVKMYLPGISVSEAVVEEEGEDGEIVSKVRTTFKDYDGGFNGFDQISDVMKMHIYTTPRLIKNSDGTFRQSTEKAFLTNYEIKNIADKLAVLPADINGFERGLAKLAQDPGTEGDTYRSLYAKFFDPDMYTVDGVDRASFSMLAQNGDHEVDNILSALITSFKSLQNTDRVLVSNGKVTLTKTKNTELAAVIKESITRGMTSSINPNELSQRVLKNLNVIKTTDGFVINLGKRFSIEYGSSDPRNNTNGVPVIISEGSRAQFETTEGAVAALEMLGFPSEFGRKFVNHYKEHIEDFARKSTAGTYGMELPNMIANFAFMAAMNDEVSRENLGTFVIPVDKQSKEDESLPYPPFEHVYAYTDAIGGFLEITEGLLAKKMIINAEGNIVATTTPRHAMADTEEFILNVRDSENDSVHRDDVFVKEEYSLNDFVYKDGITVNGEVKSNTNMTRAEQHKYLIEDLFLKFAAENDFKKAIIQPGVMSDRSTVPMAVISAMKNNVFLSAKKGKKGENAAMLQFIQGQKDHHNNLSDKVVDVWKKQLNLWLKKPAKWHNFTSAEVKAIKDINSLNSFLESAKIPMDRAKASTTLVNQLMYVKKDGVAGVKNILVEMTNVWNDAKQSEVFAKRAYRQFRNDLRRSGYTAQTMSHSALEILKERFSTRKRNLAFNKLTEAYFYQSNTISNSIMNLNTGSFYQFKGDMDITNHTDTKAANKFKAKLESDGKTDEEVKDILAHTARNLAIDEALNSMFVDQAKRNSLITSGMQRPRLAKSTEKGGFMDEYTTSALIDDPEVAIKLLGNLGGVDQEIYDAAMFAHPLYFLKLNNSLGNRYSGFLNKGGAVKDVSVERDLETGVFRTQKKATFNQFSHEMLKKGSPELDRLFRKMNESVPFKGGLEHEGVTYNNLQELWESRGAVENENSWKEVLDILAENPEHRMSYIEKVGFKSGEKAGNKGFNTSKEAWDSNSKLKYTEFSNEHHGVILNADHDPDTTHSKHAEKSLMTQVISAAVFQGETSGLANDINTALLELSEASLDRIQQEIFDGAVNMLRNRALKPDNFPKIKELGIKKVLDLTSGVATDPSKLEELNRIVNELGLYEDSIKEYTRSLTEDAVKTREAFGIVNDLVDKDVAGLDTMQLQNVVHSSVMAHLNKSTTRVKFKGQEYVVAASHDFIKLYKIEATGMEVTRDEYVNSEHVPYETVDSEDKFNALSSYDTVRVNDDLMPLWKAIKTAGGRENLGNFEAKIPREGRGLEWIGYTDSEGNKLDAKDDKGNFIVKEYRELWDNGVAIADALKNKDKKTAKKLKAEREDLEVALMELMEDESKGWVSQDAEFYMPMTHMKAFGLHDPNTGEPGTIYNRNTGKHVPISISTIMGTEQTGKKLYFKNGVETDNKEGADLVYESEFESMRKFFAKRIKKHAKANKLYKFDSLESITIGQLNNMKAENARKLDVAEAGTYQFENLQREANIFNAIVLPSEGVNDTDVLADEVVNAINEVRLRNKNHFINALAEKRARSFPKTLSILAARIPAQGKQSYISGRVKGFITSNRNNIYGPPEMLTVTGADHDIDKSHVLTYSVDSDGALYDYRQFLDENNEISRKIYKDKLAEKVKKHGAYLESKGTLTEEQITTEIQKLKERENHYLSESIKNYVLDKLMESVRDPRNAVEAATPVSMDKLKAQIEALGGQGSLIETEEGSVIAEEGSYVSPYNPASIPNLEIINSTGKAAVGVFATGLKGYSAAYTAWLNGIEENSPYIQFASETEKLFNDDDVLKGVFNQLYGKDINGKEAHDQSLNLYIGNQETGDIERINRKFIANIDKWADGVNPNDPEYKRQAQAWEDISELLSAATDNAKELILGRIGANGNTNGLIASAVMTGFDLTHILKLLQDPDIKAIISEVEDSTDTVKSKTKGITLEKALDNYLKKEFGKNNSKILKELSELSQTAHQLEAQGTIVAPPADIVKFNAGNPTNSSELKVVTNDGEPSSPSDIQLVEIQQLNELAKQDLNKNLSNVNRLVQNIKGAGVIIITEKLNSTDQAFVEAYAQQNQKQLFRLGTSGGWYKFTGKVGESFLPSNSEPVFHKKTALVAAIDFSDKMNLAYDRAFDATKKAIDSPLEYTKIADARNAEHNSDLTNTKAKLKREMDRYLTNGPRQLLQFSKMAKENRSITSILSINQGIPNSDWDAFNYFQRFVKAVNSIDSDKFGITIEDLNLFIESVDGKDDGKFAQELIEKYEAVKVGINPFYVLSQNKHYFGYIKSLKFAQELVRTSTFTNDAIEKIALSNSLELDRDGYSDIKNMVYGIGIEKFFQKESSDFEIAGKSYDLANNDDRARFMDDMVEITSQFKNDSKVKNNPFVNALKFDKIRDSKSDSYLKIVRTNNLNEMEDHTKAKIQLGLNKLKSEGEDYARFHDALFYYSLILNKGSRGKTSFSSLFNLETDALRNYVNFLKGMTSSEIVQAVKEMGNTALMLNNPNVITEIDTIPRRTSNNPDAAEALAEVGFIRNRNKKASVNSKSYIMPSRKYNKTLNTFRSRQTGKYYVWNPNVGTSGSYVVVTAKNPLKAIPYSTSSDGIEAAGFQWGETAIIDIDGNKGQVLKYDQGEGNYIVQIGNNTPTRMTAEELTDFNPDMLFQSSNFGKLPMEDRNNPDFNRVKDESETNFWDFGLSQKEKKEILSDTGALKYKVLAFTPEDAVPGDKIGSARIADGVYADVIYRGTQSSKSSHIKLGLGRSNDYDNLTYQFKKGEIASLPVVEFQLTSTPYTLNNDIPLAAPNTSSKVGGRISERIRQSRATHFSTSVNINIAEGDTKLVKFTDPSSNRSSWFKVTSHGNTRTYAASEGKSKTELFSMLGYTSTSGMTSVNKMVASNSEHNMYSVEPYNAKGETTNSHLEYRFLENSTEPNLVDIKLNLVAAQSNANNATIKAKAEEFGVRGENIEVVHNSSLTEEGALILDQAIKDRNGIYSKGGQSTSDFHKRATNTILGSDAVVVVGDFNPETSNSQRQNFIKLGLTPEQRMSEEEKQLTFILNRNEESDHEAYLEDLIASINSNDLDPEEARLFKSITGGDISKLKRIAQATLDTLSRPSDVPNEIKNVNFQDSFVPSQVAKYSGKPLYIYSPSRQQWFQYNAGTGGYDATRIPTMEGTTAVFSMNTENKIDGQALDGLLKKTSSFKQKQFNGLGELRSVNEIAFGSGDINEDLNTPVETADPLKGFKKVTKVELTQSIIDEETSKVYRGAIVNGEEVISSDFITMDNATISRYTDGSISIESKTEYGKSYFWVGFPNTKTKAKYGDFKGDSVRENFKVKINDEHFVFDELHRTDKDAFQRRDQLVPEKKEIKRMFADAQSDYENNVSPLYSEIRYESIDSAEKFKHYDSYGSFMLHLLADNLDIDPKHDEAVSALIDAHKAYKVKHEAAWKYYREVRDANTKEVPKVNGVKGSFFDSEKSDSDVLVFMTDNLGTHKHIDKRVRAGRAYQQKAKTGIQDPTGDGMRAYAIPVALKEGNDYVINNKNYIKKSIKRLFDIARDNSDKTFYVEMPSDKSSKFYGNIEGIDVVKAIADAISGEKIKGVPSNVKFTNGGSNGEHIINEYRGGLNPEDINVTVPFSVTRDATIPNTFDIDRYSPYTQKLGEATLASLWNLERGYAAKARISLNEDPLKGSEASEFGNKKEAYKNLWRRWAEANPEKFEQMAMRIGKKTIYDNYFSSDAEFSTGLVLAELLTERFVDNSWIDYPRSTFNSPTEFKEGQTLLPITGEDMATIDFTTRNKGGKSMLTINGKTYIARIENVSVKPADSLSMALIEKLGLGRSEDPFADLDKRYPFTTTNNYALLNLSEFKGELKEAKPVIRGEFYDKFEAADIDLSEEHERLSKEATVAYGIDTKARISDSLEASSTGSSWIREYKRVIGEGLVLDITSDDSVWIYGSKLEDRGNNPEMIRGVVNATKSLIKKATEAGAEILVGSETGVEEEIRAYIMSKYPDYVPTENGFKFKEAISLDMKEDIRVHKIGGRIGRFNANNNLAREGGNLTGAWGTIVYSTKDAAKVSTGKESGTTADYRLRLNSDEIVDWDSTFSSDELIKLLDKVVDTTKPESTRFEAVRGTLLVGEQRFVKRLIGSSLMTEDSTPEKLYSVLDLDAYIDKLVATDEEFATKYEELIDKLFDESGRFKLSDAASLAMARSRNITLNYVKEVLPEIFENDIESHVYFDLIQSERMDRGRAYFKMLNEDTIAKTDLDLIKASKNITYRDAYNLLKTYGENKIISKGGAIDGQLTNKLFSDLGIKAFRDGDKMVVIDNDLIYSDRNKGTVYHDYNKSDNYKASNIEVDIANRNPKVYKYIKSKGMLKVDPYTDEIRLLMSDEVRTYEANKDGYNDLVADVQSLVGLSYFNKLEGVNLSEDYLRALLVDDDHVKVGYLINNHIRYKRSPKSDNFNLLFMKESIGDLPSNEHDFESGNVYTDTNEIKTFLMKDEDGWFAQSADGALYRFKDNSWNKVEGIDNKELSYIESRSNAVANPKSIGEVFDSLITTNNEQLYGEFEISENMDSADGLNDSEILATNLDNNKKYRWEKFANAWASIDQAALLGSEASVDTDVVAGQRVISLATPAGNILLSNGKATDIGTVIDDKGTYKRDKNGMWNQSSFKGGFKNNKVRFQKDVVSYVNTAGQTIASKMVAKPVMRKVFNKIFEGLNIEAQLLTTADIKAEYGVRYADASGFVRDGVVVINIDNATLDTPLHEFGGHIYLAHLKATQPESYNDIIRKSLEHPIAEKIAEKYPENNEEEMGEEIFSTLFGLENQSKLEEQSLTLWQKIRKIADDASSIVDFFRQAFDTLFDTKSYNFELDVKDSLMTIIDKLGNDIIFGDNSVLGDLTNGQIENLKKAMNSTEDQESIAKKLKELGYIKQICI